MLRSRSSRRSRRCSVHRRGNQPDRSLRGYTSGAARGAGWTGLPPFLETVRNRRPRSSFHALHESPPFDGLSANRGGEIRCRRSDLCRRQSTRDLLNPIRVAVRALTCIHLHSFTFRRFHLHSVALIPPHFVTATVTVQQPQTGVHTCALLCSVHLEVFPRPAAVQTIDVTVRQGALAPRSCLSNSF
jgi:hypothetical protein